VRLNLTQRGGSYQRGAARRTERERRAGGAWPLQTRGVARCLIAGTRETGDGCTQHRRRGHGRSVMPLVRWAARAIQCPWDAQMMHGRGTGACNGATNEEFQVAAAHEAAAKVSL